MTKVRNNLQSSLDIMYADVGVSIPEIIDKPFAPSSHRGVLVKMKLVLIPLTSTGRIMGKTVNFTSNSVVWIMSSVARLLMRPFSC